MMFPSRTMPTRRHTLFTILALFIDYRYGSKVLSGEDFLPTIGRRFPNRADGAERRHAGFVWSLRPTAVGPRCAAESNPAARSCSIDAC
jgi:hypothetical protein